jgi:hypothetical protein
MSVARIATAASVLALAAAVWAVSAAPPQGGGRRWAKYENEMQNPADDPPDAWEKTEFAFARLRYRSGGGGRFRGGRWGIDANKSERQFIQGLRRLTRIHARSVEEIVDIDSDEIFDWPWIYAVGPGGWVLSESQAKRLRQYFERGGTLMVDDFHNESEWAGFMSGINQVLPGHEVVDLENGDQILHIAYDLSERYRVPGLNVVHGSQIERGGVDPHFRAVLDSKGRVQVQIFFNMDLGDAWEWADLPEYPEKYASMAYRLGVNYILYSLTH